MKNKVEKFKIEELEERLESINIIPRQTDPNCTGCGSCISTCDWPPCDMNPNCPRIYPGDDKFRVATY